MIRRKNVQFLYEKGGNLAIAFDFCAKTAVTKGAARGFALATARAMAARGANRVPADREASAIEGASDQVRQSVSPRVEGGMVDVADFAATQRLAEELRRNLGGIHIVFNNTGAEVSAPGADMGHDERRRTIDADLWGPIHGDGESPGIVRRRFARIDRAYDG